MVVNEAPDRIDSINGSAIRVPTVVVVANADEFEVL